MASVASFSAPNLQTFQTLRLTNEKAEYARFLHQSANASTNVSTKTEELQMLDDDHTVQLIIDTDLGFDVDDAGALAIANHLQDIGKCKILAVIHNTAFYKGIGGVDVINHYYRRKNLDLGAYKGGWGANFQSAQDKYTSTIEASYPSNIKNYDEVYDAVQAYSKVLASAADRSVVIASIGELTNIRDILKINESLFVQKVKEVHYMDGAYNFGCGDSYGSGTSPWLGSTSDCDGAAQYTQVHIPHTIKQTYSLNGGSIYTGGRFNSGCGDGPVKESYQIWTNYGSRPSWDLIVTYFAVMGTTSLYSSESAGTDYVDYAGNENFDRSNTANNEFQVWIDASHDGDVTRILDDVLCASPCRGEADVGACAGYTLHSGYNCYNGHGATDLENPSSSSAGIMSLADCQKRCDETASCDSVVVSAAASSGGLVNCYRKANTVIGSCDYGAWNYETWVKR